MRAKFRKAWVRVVPTLRVDVGADEIVVRATGEPFRLARGEVTLLYVRPGPWWIWPSAILGCRYGDRREHDLVTCPAGDAATWLPRLGWPFERRPGAKG